MGGLLAGRIALITGAGSGIGEGIAPGMIATPLNARERQNPDYGHCA